MKSITAIAKIVLISLTLFAIGSCERIHGCTDAYAYNYNPDAQVDNGSCQYGVIFWTATSSFGNITVNIHNVSSDITSYITGGVPSCGFTGCATFELKPGVYPYSASSTSGASWTGTVNITGYGCQPIQLN
jgi:hypothetical protein